MDTLLLNVKDIDWFCTTIRPLLFANVIHDENAIIDGTTRCTHHSKCHFLSDVLTGGEGGVVESSDVSKLYETCFFEQISS